MTDGILSGNSAIADTPEHPMNVRETSVGPAFIDMEPTIGCNLRCRMCHVSFMKEKPRYLDLDRVSSWRGFEGKHISLGSVYEPTIHPQFNALIGILNDLGCTISLVTNAKNLNQKELGNLFSSKLGVVTFSFDGATKESYEYVRRYGKFASTIENIRCFVGNAFASNSVSQDTTFVVNFTANKSNMTEIKEALFLWSELRIDTLNVIAMVSRFNDEFFLKNSLENNVTNFCSILDGAATFLINTGLPISIRSPYFSDANNSFHNNPMWKRFRVGTNIISTGKGRTVFDTPLHRKYNFGQSAIGHINCRAPYTTARIDFDGNIFICQSIRVGNIYESDLLGCWEGSQRDHMIRRLKSNKNICNNCGYFKFCINSSELDYAKAENFRLSGVVDRSNSRQENQPIGESD